MNVLKTTFDFKGFLIALAILFVVILLIIIYTIPVKMANKRGRSGLGWFVFTLFFSPFLAMLFLALLGETDEKRLERTIEEEEFRNRSLNKWTSEMKKCPQCAELIKEEATVCRYCGNIKPNIIQSDSDISPLDDWKKNNPNQSLNDYYKNLGKNRINIPSIVNRPPPLLIESQRIKNNLLYDRPILKLLIICLVIIALFRYEYIGNKIKQAGTFIAEKINGIKDPDGFNETSFSSRESELAYIREYVRYKLITEERQKFDNSKNGLKEYASLMLEIFMAPKIEEIMSEVVRQDLNIIQVKEKVRVILKEMAKKEAERETQNRAREKYQEEYREREEEKYREERRRYEDEHKGGSELEKILHGSDSLVE